MKMNWKNIFKFILPCGTFITLMYLMGVRWPWLTHLELFSMFTLFSVITVSIIWGYLWILLLVVGGIYVLAHVWFIKR